MERALKVQYIFAVLTLLLYSYINGPRPAELGASLFQIALLLFALERNLISGAKERYKKKSEDRRANYQICILDGSLLGDIRKKEWVDSKSDFKDRAFISS